MVRHNRSNTVSRDHLSINHLLMQQVDDLRTNGITCSPSTDSKSTSSDER